jgi:hypothetical protein
MTGDRWLTAAYLMWLLFTGFYMGLLVGREWMRRTLTRNLAKVIRDGDLVVKVRTVVGK